MEQFAVAGSDFLRLSRFCAGQKNRGTVARSLAEFLSCFIHCYTAAVVSTQGGIPFNSTVLYPVSLSDKVGTLIQLRTVLHKQIMTLRCVLHVCSMFVCLCVCAHARTHARLCSDIHVVTDRLMAKLCHCDQHPDNIHNFPRVSACNALHMAVRGVRIHNLSRACH